MLVDFVCLNWRTYYFASIFCLGFSSIADAKEFDSCGFDDDDDDDRRRRRTYRGILKKDLGRTG